MMKKLKPMQGLTYNYISDNSKKTLFFKIHDAFLFDIFGKPIVPVNSTKYVIYFVRNPLDIVISFANHNNDTIDSTIKNMGNIDFRLGQEKGGQLLQSLLSWSQHYLSWVERSEVPIKVVKYEDILINPLVEFKSILLAIDLNYNDLEINKAIKASSFEKLKKQEYEKGFLENNTNTNKFFKHGKSGTWKGKLSEEQINKVIADHGAVMKKLGYI